MLPLRIWVALQEEQIVLRSSKCELREPGYRGSVISLLRRQTLWCRHYSQDVCAQRCGVKHGREGVGIEATMFSITWTDSKEDHHMPHRHKQQTFTCDWTVRKQRDSKGIWTKA